MPDMGDKDPDKEEKIKRIMEQRSKNSGKDDFDLAKQKLRQRKAQLERKGKGMGITMLVVIILAVLAGLSIRRVPAGYVGVYTNGMNIGTQKDSGWVLKNPLSTMEKYRFNTQSIEETVVVTSIEGDGSGYNVPMDFQVVYNLKKEKMGALIVENPDYMQTKIIQKLRSRTRQIVADYNMSGIEINQKKSWIQAQVSTELEEYLDEFHILVEEVALRNVELPTNVQQASQKRQQSEIMITTAHNEYLAELEQVKKKIANADADYNVTVINANAERQKRIIEANGSAEAIAKIQNQFDLEDDAGSARVYLQYLYMSALSDPNSNIKFVIVPSGTNGTPLILDMGGQTV